MSRIVESSSFDFSWSQIYTSLAWHLLNLCKSYHWKLNVCPDWDWRILAEESSWQTSEVGPSTQRGCTASDACASGPQISPRPAKTGILAFYLLRWRANSAGSGSWRRHQPPGMTCKTGLWKDPLLVKLHWQPVGRNWSKLNMHSPALPGRHQPFATP